MEFLLGFVKGTYARREFTPSDKRSYFLLMLQLGANNRYRAFLSVCTASLPSSGLL